jgi:hypothetical protein
VSIVHNSKKIAVVSGSRQLLTITVEQKQWLARSHHSPSEAWESRIGASWARHESDAEDESWLIDSLGEGALGMASDHQFLISCDYPASHVAPGSGNQGSIFFVRRHVKFDAEPC